MSTKTKSANYSPKVTGIEFRPTAAKVTGAVDQGGKPDLVVRSKRLAVFVDGDFWHGNAHRLRGLSQLEELFPTNTDWWVAKISRNVERDREVTSELESSGWRVWSGCGRAKCSRTRELRPT